MKISKLRFSSWLAIINVIAMLGYIGYFGYLL